MIIGIFMALVLLITLIVIFSLVKNTFSLLFKILFTIALLVVLVGSLIGLELKNQGKVIEESNILISNNSTITRGYAYVKTDLYKLMSQDELDLQIKKINSSSLNKNETIVLINNPSPELNNKTTLTLLDVRFLTKNSKITIYPATKTAYILNKLRFK